MNRARTLAWIGGLAAMGAAAGAALTWSGPATTLAPAAPARSAAYTIDPVHSTFLFRILHNNAAPFYGRFNTISGSFSFEDEKCTLELTIQTESVDTNNADRDRHLRSPDFFNTRQFPTATFKSTSSVRVSDGVFDVTGDLTLHGETKPVTVRVKDVRTGQDPRSRRELCGFEATATVKRSEFGITTYPGALGEDVLIVAGIEGGR